MTQRLLSIAVASLAGLVSCAAPPPPRFQTDPSVVIDPVSPDEAQGDVSAPTDPMPSAPTTPPATPGAYPTAQRTANPEQVISPYEPFNVIDVAGFASGKLVRDPSNQKIFRVP
jgi:hypothetical protein